MVGDLCGRLADYGAFQELAVQEGVDEAGLAEAGCARDQHVEVDGLGQLLVFHFYEQVEVGFVL